MSGNLTPYIEAWLTPTVDFKWQVSLTLFDPNQDEEIPFPDGIHTVGGAYRELVEAEEEAKHMIYTAQKQLDFFSQDCKQVSL